jgi:hypothetical protein
MPVVIGGHEERKDKSDNTDDDQRKMFWLHGFLYILVKRLRPPGRNTRTSTKMTNPTISL